MADTYDWTASGQIPSVADIFSHNNAMYLGRGGRKSTDVYRDIGKSGGDATGTFGIPAQKVGLSSLLKMLLQEGRVDPRLLAQAQVQNARSTQQQKQNAVASSSRSGFSGGGLNQALLAAIGSAGANRAANLNYQDIADSYKRQQENFGLLTSMVIQPELGYASLGLQDTLSRRDAKQKQIASGVSLMGAGLGALSK